MARARPRILQFEIFMDEEEKALFRSIGERLDKLDKVLAILERIEGRQIKVKGRDRAGDQRSARCRQFRSKKEMTGEGVSRLFAQSSFFAPSYQECSPGAIRATASA